MTCCVLIDIGRSWLKFTSHSLLLLQRNKGCCCCCCCFNLKNRKPSYLYGDKHKTGLLFDKQHLVFPLFSTQTTGHLCIMHPRYPFFGILSCQELTNCCVKGGAFPLNITLPARDRQGLGLKQGEDICLDSVNLPCSRNIC